MKNNYYVIINKGVNTQFLKYLDFLNEYNITWRNTYNRYLNNEYKVMSFWDIKKILRTQNMEHYIGYKIQETINNNGNVDLNVVLRKAGI